MGVTDKAFSEGSAFPEHSDPNLLRVYSMRFCPYAQRTRLLVRHLNIPHEEVNINLKSKPDWFLARNPQGQVPVLELGDKIVYESAVCNEYLNDVHSSKLFPTDPYQKARVKILMELFSKVTDKFYLIMVGKKTPEEKEQAAEEMRKQLIKYEDAISTGKFFVGDQPSLLDFHIWPWFERFPTLEKLGGVKIVPEDKFPRLSSWIKNMREVPAVKSVIQPDELHTTFVQEFLAGGVVNYDLGL